MRLAVVSDVDQERCIAAVRHSPLDLDLAKEQVRHRVLDIVDAQLDALLITYLRIRFVVIDEIAGIVVALAWVPPSVIALAAGFILFRLLDIIKPPPINWIDRRVKGGLGIVLDDLIAGLGANIVLQIALRST